VQSIGEPVERERAVAELRALGIDRHAHHRPEPLDEPRALARAE
jgi:hypothetical protein